MKLRLAGYLLVLLVLGPTQLQAATCSCAGMPLLSAIDSSSTEPGDIFVNLTTENHEINDLVQGKDEIKDETRRHRSTLSQAVSATYGLANHWSLSGLISYVEHSREVGSSFLSGQQSSGVGDGVLLLRYTPFYITPFSRHELSLGVGARLPIGKDDAGGILTLSEDMQPSVGAPGRILWSSYNYAFNQASTIQFNASANYTDNDEENDRGYIFGDELNVSAGLSQSIRTRYGYSLGLRYRSTTADSRHGFDIPNTGGKWLDFIPAIQYSISNDLNLSLSGRIPVARDLDGVLQFSTSYSYALSLTYGF